MYVAILQVIEHCCLLFLSERMHLSEQVQLVLVYSKLVTEELTIQNLLGLQLGGGIYRYVK